MLLAYSQPSPNTHLRIKIESLLSCTKSYLICSHLSDLISYYPSLHPLHSISETHTCSLNTPSTLLPQGLCTCWSLCLECLCSRCTHGSSLTSSVSVSGDFLLIIFSVRLFLDTLSTISSSFNILSKMFLYPSYPHLLPICLQVSITFFNIFFINVFLC